MFSTCQILLTAAGLWLYLTETGKGRIIQTWNVREGIPDADTFASFLVSALLLHNDRNASTNLFRASSTTQQARAGTKNARGRAMRWCQNVQISIT